MPFRSLGRACAAVALFAAGLGLAEARAATAAHVVEGTEFPIRFDEKLSSKTNSEGDRFSISLADEVKLSDGTVIRAGYKGVGEVVDAQKNGMLGKAGTLNVRFEYMKIGDVRVHIRGSKGKEGKGSIASVVALTVLFGPLGLLVKGHNVEVKQGQEMTAYVDQDTDVPLPLSPPPEAK
jgi:hypothetical protein